jgi:hypothetical protein
MEGTWKAQNCSHETFYTPRSHMAMSNSSGIIRPQEELADFELRLRRWSLKETTRRTGGEIELDVSRVLVGNNPDGEVSAQLATNISPKNGINEGTFILHPTWRIGSQISPVRVARIMVEYACVVCCITADTNMTDKNSMYYTPLLYSAEYTIFQPIF